MKYSNKGVTKHLYRMDEVLSSLRWSIITKNIYETAFWATEVYESDMLQEGLEVLEHTWLTHVGFGSWFCFRLILAVYNDGEISLEDWVSVTCAFARVEICDSTISHLLLRGATTPADWQPHFPHSVVYNGLEDAIKDCLRRGKLQDAWLLGRAMAPSAQWELLESLAEVQGRDEELGWLKQFRPCVYECLAAAYTLVSIDSITWSSSQQVIDRYYCDELDQWKKEKSMRKRRVLKPRAEALVYMCLSGDSRGDIMLDLEKTLKQSPYWIGVLSGYMMDGQWISDLKKEGFYEQHFTDDIPDEWSLEDREKSHRLNTGDNKRPQYIYHTLRHSKSLEIWDSKFPDGFDCSMEWSELYEELFKQTSGFMGAKFPMKPFRKVFEIIL